MADQPRIENAAAMAYHLPCSARIPRAGGADHPWRQPPGLVDLYEGGAPFLKVQTQTIWAPAVTTLLFLVIFTVAMGRATGWCWG
jgi:ABC-2 type transport system permease protein